MSEINQEAVTKFAEVLPQSISKKPYRQNPCQSSDRQIMVICQDMKIYFPENIRPESLRTFLSVLKQL